MYIKNRFVYTHEHEFLSRELLLLSLTIIIIKYLRLPKIYFYLHIWVVHTYIVAVVVFFFRFSLYWTFWLNRTLYFLLRKILFGAKVLSWLACNIHFYGRRRKETRKASRGLKIPQREWIWEEYKREHCIYWNSFERLRCIFNRYR